MALDPPDAACRGKLRGIADRVRHMRARGMRVSEEDTERVLITPAVEALGWDIFDTDEIRNEYRHATADNPVDYALFLARSPVLSIEAKPLGHSLDDRRWMVQTLNYANAAGVDWCLLTNGAEYRIYKVHARGEAEGKLFQTVSLEDANGFEDACRLLGLLTRERMSGKAIDGLWEAWHIDRQVRDAFESVLRDDRFLGLIRQRLPDVGMADIRRSLHRADVRIAHPPLFRDAAPCAPVHPPPPVQAAAADGPGPRITGAGEADTGPVVNGVEAEGRRGGLQRTAELFALGRLKAGDVLAIRGREGSHAKVVDGSTVEYRGRRMSYSDWGKAVTGWRAIRIYDHAVLPDGKTVGELRDRVRRAPE